MMKEVNDGETSDKVVIDLTYEIYLKGRETPINHLVTFALSKSRLDEGEELEDLMQIAVQHALATLDTVREHRLIYSDRRFNKGIFLTDQIQAITILAPDRDNLSALLEGN